ncbi:hypothetical protein JCM6882_009259 [Rhodosporidiobolus microsporus]
MAYNPVFNDAYLLAMRQDLDRAEAKRETDDSEEGAEVDVQHVKAGRARVGRAMRKSERDIVADSATDGGFANQRPRPSSLEDEERMLSSGHRHHRRHRHHHSPSSGSDSGSFASDDDGLDATGKPSDWKNRAVDAAERTGTLAVGFHHVQQMCGLCVVVLILVVVIVFLVVVQQRKEG